MLLRKKNDRAIVGSRVMAPKLCISHLFNDHPSFPPGRRYVHDPCYIRRNLIPQPTYWKNQKTDPPPEQHLLGISIWTWIADHTIHKNIRPVDVPPRTAAEEHHDTGQLARVPHASHWVSRVP